MQSREPAFWFLKKGPLIIRAEVTQEFADRVTKGQSADDRGRGGSKAEVDRPSHQGPGPVPAEAARQHRHAST